MKNKLTLGILIAAFVMVLASCYTPSPLYGTWMDDTGTNKIMFMDDGSFTASILKEGEDENSTYSGTWAVIDNVLSLSVNYEDISYKRNSEWDIRGAMLYLHWTDETSNTVTLTLYHTAR